MAKTRAQRKAERRRRQAAEQRGLETGRDEAERQQEERAQEDTQRGVSGEVAEAEAVIETGARTEDYGERVEPREEIATEGGGSPVPRVLPAPVQPETASEPAAPAPSRADVGRPEDGATAEAT